MKSNRICGVLLAAAGLLVVLNTPSTAIPTLGFREDFPGVSGIGTWGGGATLSNPGTGGFGGASDGYLLIARDAPGALGANSTSAAYAGDWTTSGITQIRLWLTNPHADAALEIHVSIGNSGNLWQYTAGFAPPNGTWGEFVVDLTSPALFTRIIGAGTFAQALQTADRILIRHDKAPYIQSPDPLQGDFGVDHILLTNGVAGVPDAPRGITRPVQLSPAFPNPSRTTVTFIVATAAVIPVRLEVIDAGGRSMRRVLLPPAPGSRRWIWDGRNDHGVRVPPGSYRVLAIGPSGGMSQPVVRIR